MKNQILFFYLIIHCYIGYAQPKELFRGRHKIGGMTYGHPYTTFDRHNGLSFYETIKKIRAQIISESDTLGPVFIAYKKLVDYAEGTRPKDEGLIIYVDGKANAPSDLAVWAKDNAFVFLIGLDRNAKWMDTTDYNGVISNAKRDSFRDRVYMDDYSSNADMSERNAFFHLTDEVPWGNNSIAALFYDFGHV